MPVSKGLRVEIFLRSLQKNTTRPLLTGKAERTGNVFRPLSVFGSFFVHFLMLVFNLHCFYNVVCDFTDLGSTPICKQRSVQPFQYFNAFLNRIKHFYIVLRDLGKSQFHHFAEIAGRVF